MMTDMVLPTVGSSGFFKLRSPFDQLVLQNERYTCQAIRRLSDYIAANEDPKKDIYTVYQLTDEDWNQDSKANMFIVSLQSDTGHWLYVPARFILTFPQVNGIPYRTVMLGVSLPSLPVNRDLDFVMDDIKNLIKDSLGVDCVIKPVETSRVVLVPKETHDIKQSERNLVSAGRGTDRARYKDTQQQLDNALTRIRALEQFIIDKGIA